MPVRLPGSSLSPLSMTQLITRPFQESANIIQIIPTYISHGMNAYVKAAPTGFMLRAPDSLFEGPIMRHSYSLAVNPRDPKNGDGLLDR